MLFSPNIFFPIRNSLKTLSEFAEAWLLEIHSFLLSCFLFWCLSSTLLHSLFPQDHECIHFMNTSAQVAFHLPIFSHLLILARIVPGISICFLQNIKIWHKNIKSFMNIHQELIWQSMLWSPNRAYSCILPAYNKC